MERIVLICALIFFQLLGCSSKVQVPEYIKVSSNGEAATPHEGLMGIYKLQDEYRNNFTVWKKEEDQYLFVNSYQFWGIGSHLDSFSAWIYNNKKNPTPVSPLTLTDGWKYYDGEWKTDNAIRIEAFTEPQFGVRAVPKIEEVRQELEKVRRELEKSVLETNKLKKDLEAKDSHISKINSKVKSLKDLLKNSKNEIKGNNEQLKQTKMKYADLKIRFEKIKEDHDTFKNNSSNKIFNLIKDLEARDSDISKIDSKVQNLEDLLKNSKIETNVKIEELKQNKKKNEDLKIRFEKIKEDHDTFKNNSSNKIFNLNKDLEAKDSDISKIDSKVKNLEDQLKKSKIETNIKIEELKQTEKKNEDLKIRFEKIKKDHDTLKNNYDILKEMEESSSCGNNIVGGDSDYANQR